VNMKTDAWRQKESVEFWEGGRGGHLVGKKRVNPKRSRTVIQILKSRNDPYRMLLDLFYTGLQAEKGPARPERQTLRVRRQNHRKKEDSRKARKVGSTEVQTETSRASENPFTKKNPCASQEDRNEKKRGGDAFIKESKRDERLEQRRGTLR